MSCPFPWKLSDFYAGGVNVPVGATGINGPIPSAGPIKFSDFYGSPIISDYNFLAGYNGLTGFSGIHTTSLVIPRFGVWNAPLPVIPNPPGTDSNGVMDTTSNAIILPDGFSYTSGTIQAWVDVNTSIPHFLLSLSRWNGVSFDLANINWIPFNNIIINGLGWNNINIPKTALIKSTVPSFPHELFFQTAIPSVQLPPYPYPDTFTPNNNFSVTFN